MCRFICLRRDTAFESTVCVTCIHARITCTRLSTLRATTGMLELYVDEADTINAADGES